MESRTKLKLEDYTIKQLVKEGLKENVEIETISELPGGGFASLYKIVLVNGEKVVLKLSVAGHGNELQYEQKVMETEVRVLRKLQVDNIVPVPKVLCYDDTKSILEVPYFFMEWVEGVQLSTLYDKLLPMEQAKISKQLAEYTLKLHSFQENYFGVLPLKHKQFTTWKETFLFMIKELLEDAEAKEVLLPYDYKTFYAKIERHSHCLEEVTEGRLVHKDLWYGNIMVDPNGLEITSIIDFERAIVADPLLDIVCGFLMDNTFYMKHYMGRDLTVGEKERAVLYEIYLFLLMVIECYYRGYSKEQEAWPREKLEKAVRELERWDER